MLKKLFKHDFRALSRTLLPVELAVLGASVVVTVILTVCMRLAAGGKLADWAEAILMGTSVSASVLVGLAVLASPFVALLFIALYFYNNLMTSQGYLTFTLPTTPGKILWSKLLTGMIWALVSFAVLAASGAFFMLFGTSTSEIVNGGAVDLITSLFRGLPILAEFGNVPLLTLELIVFVLLALAQQLLHIYFAVVIGGMVAKRKKLLASIGMYFLINIGVSILSTIYNLVFGLGLSVWTGAAVTVFNDLEASAFTYAAIGWNILWQALLCVVFFLLSRAILTKKLNLQ